MDFYISKGICEREGTYKVTTLKNKLILTMPSYMEKQQEYEHVNFIFYDATRDIRQEELEGGLFKRDITLSQYTSNVYEIEINPKIKNPINSVCFALLKGYTSVPDDVFIPKAMAKKVKVISQITPVDSEADYGEFLAHAYFVKIRLDINESLPIFYAYNNPYLLQEHDVICRHDCRNGAYTVKTGLETYILLNDENKDEYISLSKLCKK